MSEHDDHHAGAAEISPFHAGEIALQERAGVHPRIDQVGRKLIRDHLTDQHREFFALLPTLLVAGRDQAGRPWATMLAGSPGFVSSPDAWHLRIAAALTYDDPVISRLACGDAIGLLGLQPHTRRRNRMNGTISAIDAAGFSVRVRQSFGNCPKYIQARTPEWGAVAISPRRPAVSGGARLERHLVQLIGAADTFFIASCSADPQSAGPSEGLDVSHRGGRPGFVRCDVAHDHSVLTIPDFVGNFLFNTLGNLLVNPACGLLFVDYADGGLLHLAGDAEIVWESAEVAAFAGAERLWRVHVTASLWRPGALPLRWSAPAFAPQLEELGDWDHSAADDTAT